MEQTSTTTTSKNEFVMRPVVDFCFKELMRNEKVRKGFVAALLPVSPEQIKDTTLLPTELEKNELDGKLGILDVRVSLSDGTQMDLEVQVRYFKYWDERAIFYLCKMAAGQLKEGDSYGKLQKCIHVSILDFIHYPEDNHCYRTIHLIDEKTGKIYNDKLELKILELKKLGKSMPDQEDIASWMKFFLGRRKEEFEEMAKTNEYLEEACKELFHLSEDEKMRLKYQAREKAIMDYNTQMESAKEDGIEEGLRKGIEALILDNLEDGCPRERILLKLQKRFNLTAAEAEKHFRQISGEHS
ncbi:MAG: Rpn family recombination-promoting nuclease/putative transposase [Lachnospiraceae bacterium]|nr:Rpn family recombination-promoting nuclease/putative transposase [Lachnospiraceae bacterium]